MLSERTCSKVEVEARDNANELILHSIIFSPALRFAHLSTIVLHDPFKYLFAWHLKCFYSCVYMYPFALNINDKQQGLLLLFFIHS